MENSVIYESEFFWIPDAICSFVSAQKKKNGVDVSKDVSKSVIVGVTVSAAWALRLTRF